jgi:hypothetical protein
MIRTITLALLGTALATVAATAPAHAAPRTTLYEGTQVVGQDVAPGMYSTNGPRPKDYGYCFITWLPYKGAKSSELIDMESYAGPSYVQLNAGDVVTVEGCDWIHE